MTDQAKDGYTTEELFQAALYISSASKRKVSQSLSRYTDKAYILISNDGSILSRIPLSDVYNRCDKVRNAVAIQDSLAASLGGIASRFNKNNSRGLLSLAADIFSSPKKVGVTLFSFAVILLLATQYAHRRVPLSGTLILIDSDSVTGSWNDCRGTGGYDDIQAGKQVTIRNKAGEIVASTSYKNLDIAGLELLLKSKNWSSEKKTVSELQSDIQSKAGVSCVLYFTSEVPANLDFIQIDSRGTLVYTKKELVDKNYILGFSLGT